ncbi:MAG TPA: phosphoribosylanthranilate isomerase [Candidatus Sumerlaeota bacterium]|nr:phosphoribosylanthranilate isomerase [Candidatus Sumerlaeota bacterium]HOR28980.1 phosphoribosylanthranilate isomerase [Candidatus Sumerlaeota bacterium]HPK03293.1 phosphoribosylanthranilate isomerase [Candidatus Sumerlaeota bacterium]
MTPPAPDRCLIKICGVTRPEDGLFALESGADWLGFIRWPKSARYRPAEDCAAALAAIRRAAPRPFQAVGVYVNADPAVIAEEGAAIGFDRFQLHGEETPEYARALARPVIKVLRIRDAASLAEAERYAGLDLLTDTWDPALPGGTGRGYDYTLLARLVARRRVIVSGGLTPANVGEVVRAVGPWGVDVASGVESAPGIKERAKVLAFISAVRDAEGQSAPC